MAKLGTFFMVLIAIQLSLWAFAAQTPDSNNSLWDLVTHPEHWKTTSFVEALLTLSWGMILVGVVAGSIFGFKTDFIIFAPAVAGLIGMGVIIFQLYDVLSSDLAARFGCTYLDPALGPTLTNCPPVQWILWITVSPLAVYYIWTVVENWRGKDN